jgi:hypothetical protein
MLVLQRLKLANEQQKVRTKLEEEGEMEEKIQEGKRRVELISY